MSKVTYKDFVEKMRAELWPYPGEAESLKEAHATMFQEAFYELQKHVEGLRENHTDVFPACSTYVQCGVTVLECPYEEISRVYTIANQEWCDLVFYTQVSYEEILRWSNLIMATWTPPANEGLPALQQGFRYVEASTDADGGRARMGVYAIHRRRLYLAPWVQSNESVVLEYQGVKRQWKDTDILDDDYWTADVARAIRCLVRLRHETDFGCDPALRKELREELDGRPGVFGLIAEAIYQDEQRRKIRAGADPAIVGRGLTQAEYDDDKIPDTEDVIFAAIGDYGDTSNASGVPLLDVSNLVKGTINPSYIVTLGDNWYGSTATLAKIDEQIGQFYRQYIYPYIGTYGDGATLENKFFPALGDHDRDPTGKYAITKKFFNLSRDYYEVVKGNVHFFILDSGYNDANVNQQADGITATSKQGEWLKLRLALSLARWKVVIIHHAPYASFTSNPEYTDLRWPFKTWGADIVMSGNSHGYERLEVDGLPFIVNGLGGAVIVGAFDLVGRTAGQYSKVRYSTDYGALKVTVSCNKFKTEFINRQGVIADTLELTKK